VTDVHAIGQLAVVRSLGRAGYYTCAMSPQRHALGLYSRFAHKKIICPSYDDEGFIDWILACVADNAIDLIIPSEGFLWAIQPVFDQLSPKLPIRPEGNFIYRYLNKYDYFRKITDATDSAVTANCPKIIFITRDTLPEETDMALMEFPCFIKLDSVYGTDKSDGDRVIKVENSARAMSEIRHLSCRYSAFLIQEYIPGQKAGVNLLIRNGVVTAHYVMRASHESPHTGGVAALRHSWHHDKMLADAIAKSRYLGWDGVLMVEYRWNPENDDFALIEINLRFWGYLHLCLYAGIDFPRLLADQYLGIPVTAEKPATAEKPGRSQRRGRSPNRYRHAA